MNYAEWVQRLRTFVSALQERSAVEWQGNFVVEIAPPLGADDLEELAESLDCGLPPPLRRFLATGASSVYFRYGGPSAAGEAEDHFCPADQLAEWRDECVSYAHESWLAEPDWPLDRAFWRHALPLVHYPDGDGVALWVHDPDHPQPAVIYLQHEDRSFLLSRTFDEFLRQWEQLGYVGTNDLECYRNPQTGFLDATMPKALALRKSLGLVS